MAWDAEAFGIAPYSGSRADQPAGLLDKMRQCLNVYNAMVEQKRAGKMSVDQLSDFYASSTGKICVMVKKLRDKHG